jgi:hypothetical protein
LRGHPSFAGEPDFGKLAVDGAWERAVVFAPGEAVEIDDDEVAIEAFFGKAFFGMRRRGPGLSRFVAEFSKAMASGGFFDALRLQPSPFEFAELGAEGAWYSVGPIRVDPASALADFDGFWREVHATRVANAAHDKALEFSFEGGYWFALPVSVDRRLDAGLLRHALEWFRSG